MSSDNPQRPSDALYARLQRDAARLLVMHEAGRVLRSTHDAEELARQLLAVIADALFSGSGCVARLRDEELEILATLGFDEHEAELLSQNEAEAGVWFHVADSPEPLTREDLLAQGLGGGPDDEDDEDDSESGVVADAEPAEAVADADMPEESDAEPADAAADADDDWQPDHADDDWQPEHADEGTPHQSAPVFEVYVPLRLEDREIGVLALGPRVDNQAFTEADAELAVSLTSQLALALHSSELFEEKEQRIEQLSVLLRLSKELTSTLEIDKVLGTVAGMIGLIVPNRRAVVALVQAGGTGTVAIHASSAEDFDKNTAGDDPLMPAIRWAHGARQEVNAGLADAEVNEDFEGRDVLLPLMQAAGGPKGLAIRKLEDEEGIVGYLVIEIDNDDPPIDDETDELVTILVNQTSVAIRNADLYQRIPMVGMLSGLKGKAGGAATRKWIKRGIWAAVIAVGLLVPLPSWISGDATVRPTRVVPVRAATEGTLETIDVNEGDVVRSGQRLGSMRRDALSVEIEEVHAAIRRTRAEAGDARTRGDLATYRARQAELNRLYEEQRFLETELERKDLLAPVAGVVLTPHVELRAGLHLARGDTFVEMADLSQMEVEILVPEEEIENAGVGSTARFKVQAFPDREFAGEVVRVSPRADENGSFRVAVQVQNQDGALRPGMTGRAHIDVQWRPVLYKPLRPLVNWFRLKFWI